MRSVALLLPIGLLVGLSFLVPACGSDPTGSGFSNEPPPVVASDASSDGPCTSLVCDGSVGKPGCVGLECKQVDCPGGGKTTLSGKVFDPAGKVPLYNVVVYVPNTSPAEIRDGASCERCDGAVSGNPVAITTTDATGSFKLENVPVVKDLPVVVQVGKWRRAITLPGVAECADTPVGAGVLRLPRNRAEGHIPRIALTTGAADPLECLLRKIGIDDAEFGRAGSDARIHLYAGGGFTDNGVLSAPSRAFASTGEAFMDATAFWGGVATLSKYDVVLLSCEGTENEAAKPEAARRALYEYTKAGGRVFASHYHNYWFSASPLPEVQAIAAWTDSRQDPAGKTETVNATLETGFPKGAALKAWLGNTGSLTASGELPIQEARHNVDAVGKDALSWIRVNNPREGNIPAIQYMSFNTPVGAQDAQVCGRVVFSDLHVGAGNTAGPPFPEGCTPGDLTAQQKTLEFMLFDLSSCVQRDDQPPVKPH